MFPLSFCFKYIESTLVITYEPGIHVYICVLGNKTRKRVMKGELKILEKV